MFPHVGLLPKEEGKQILSLPMLALLLFPFAWNIVADMLCLEVSAPDHPTLWNQEHLHPTLSRTSPLPAGEAGLEVSR